MSRTRIYKWHTKHDNIYVQVISMTMQIRVMTNKSHQLKYLHIETNMQSDLMKETRGKVVSSSSAEYVSNTSVRGLSALHLFIAY